MKISALLLAGLATFVAMPTRASDGGHADVNAEHARFTQALATSPNPRDWMLSASMLAVPSSAESVATLAKAAAAAPDDVLVQWIAATSGNEAAATALPRLQPDNGASWLPILDLVIKRGDEAAIDAALAGFSASTRFDDHYAQTLHAEQAALTRAPDAMLCSSDKVCDRAQAEFVFAMAFTAASVFPAVMPILTYCKATPAASLRRHQCETGGRNMLENGETQVSSSMGFALLRGLNALTPADEELRRQQDWLRDVTMPLHRDFDPGAPGFAAFVADWTTLDSEFEVMRRLAQRAGQPLTPPVGWVSPGQRAREAEKARGEL